MAKEKSSGCLVVAIILVVLLALLAVPLGLWFVRAKKVSIAEHDAALAREEATELAHGFPGSGEGVLVLNKGEIPKLTIPKEGEDITREHVVLFLTSDNATSLTEEAFRKVATGVKVTWLLQTVNVFDRDGVLRGDFYLPWEIRSGGGSSGSSIRVEAYFTEESRASLETLSRHEWVTVKGELSFVGNSPVLKNASVADE